MLLGLAVGHAAAAAAAPPPDPLKSPMWDFMVDQLFGDDPVRFDDRVRVVMPEIAEDQRAFPVAVDARAIAGVKRIVIFADLNPIQRAIDYRLADADAYVATRIKLDQRTPVRGAVQLEDGSWLVGGAWIDAAGGGCSAPPVSRVKGDWAKHLGEVRARAWAQAGGAKVQMAFRHPMDTGFVDNIGAYHIETISLKGADGRVLGVVAMQASVAEDPLLTLIPHARAGEVLRLDGVDTNGIAYAGAIPVPAASGPAAGGGGAARRP